MKCPICYRDVVDNYEMFESWDWIDAFECVNRDENGCHEFYIWLSPDPNRYHIVAQKNLANHCIRWNDQTAFVFSTVENPSIEIFDHPEVITIIDPVVQKVPFEITEPELIRLLQTWKSEQARLAEKSATQEPSWF